MTDDKAKKERSPSFPFIALGKAVSRASVLFEKHKREAARLSAIAPTWGYGAKSSGLLQTVAALKQFGLVEDFGSGDDRKVQLSELGRRLLIDERPGAKEAALREAAVRPRLIAEYVDRWVPDRPSDAHCISELQFDRGFTADAAKLFVKVFDDTVSYANLAANDSLSDNPISDDKPEPDPMQTATLPQRDAPSRNEPQSQRASGLPFTVTTSRAGLQGSFHLTNRADLDGLILILETLKPVLDRLESVNAAGGDAT